VFGFGWAQALRVHDERGDEPMNEDRPHILGLVWDRLLLAFLRKALPADRFRVTVAETLDAAVDALFTPLRSPQVGDVERRRTI
jgi:hypothetical protein